MVVDWLFGYVADMLCPLCVCVCGESYLLGYVLMQRINQEGKTPLIVACMNPELYTVAKTLIELGANINVYRPGKCPVFLITVYWDKGFLVNIGRFCTDYYIFEVVCCAAQNI